THQGGGAAAQRGEGVHRAANAVGTERIVDRVVPEGGGVVTAQTHFTEVAHQAHGAATLELHASRGAGVGVQTSFQPEACLHAAAEVFHATETEAAGSDTVLRHGGQAFAALLHIADVQVHDAEKGNGRLSKGSAGGCHSGQSNQSLFH